MVTKDERQMIGGVTKDERQMIGGVQKRYWSGVELEASRLKAARSTTVVVHFIHFRQYLLLITNIYILLYYSSIYREMCKFTFSNNIYCCSIIVILLSNTT